MTDPLYSTLHLPKPEGAYFDEAEAEKAVKFFQLLRHTKGKFAGQPFVLEPWQEEIVSNLFGWKQEDGLRLYRTLFLMIPRKQGKSQLAAGLAGKLLFADNEASAEVYSAAADRSQASLVFQALKGMVEASPELRTRATIHRNSISVEKTMSSYKVLSSEVGTKYGFNASAVIVDELFTQPNRELWDALTTSMGARTQPLTIALTTAGWDKNSLCYELYEYTERLSKGVVEDPSFLGIIYAASEKDEWDDPQTWAKANPNLGVTVPLEYLEKEAQKAKAIPAFQNTFKRLYENIWTSQDIRLVDMTAWDENAEPFDVEELVGRPCVGGLDIGSTTDMTAFVLCFPMDDGTFRFIPQYFIPADNIRERGLRDRVPYERWREEGLLTATPGAVVDFSFIKAAIKFAAETYQLKMVVYDRYEATQLVGELRDEGIDMYPLGQGFASMSAPTKEMLRLVLERRFHHNGHPVLRWNADSCAAQTDAAGNIKLSKSKSTARVDGLVAAVMSLEGALRTEFQPQESVYEARGVSVF